MPLSSPLTALALLLIGFSLFNAFALVFTHFRPEHYPGQSFSRHMGLLLMLALSGLQVAHFAWLYADLPWINSLPYRLALYAVASIFFLFSQPVFNPQLSVSLRPSQLGHLIPILLAPTVPDPLALSLAFILGAGYLLWLARKLYALRREGAAFQWELLLLGGVFVIALGVSGLSLIQIHLPDKLFFSLYAIAIGIAFLLVQIALGLRPQLVVDIGEAAQATPTNNAYATSTLTHVDCDKVLTQLAELMQTGQGYRNLDLNLASLAAQLGISSHQLSELMNSRLGKSFSRYLREQRVAAAKQMLLTEPSSSVLSIGMDVGFSSQSSFYEAFREIEGTSPGQFRKLKASSHVPE